MQWGFCGYDDNKLYGSFTYLHGAYLYISSHLSFSGNAGGSDACVYMYADTDPVCACHDTSAVLDWRDCSGGDGSVYRLDCKQAGEVEKEVYDRLRRENDTNVICYGDLVADCDCSLHFG